MHSNTAHLYLHHCLCLNPCCPVGGKKHYKTWLHHSCIQFCHTGHLMNELWLGGPYQLAWINRELFVGGFLYLWIKGRWMSGWVKDTERQAEWERVCTDLFLLNSSRFNQQIIDLIKWHPLLGQEPARSMRISQAKIKICFHAYWKKPKQRPLHNVTKQTQHSCFQFVGTC